MWAKFWWPDWYRDHQLTTRTCCFRELRFRDLVPWFGAKSLHGETYVWQQRKLPVNLSINSLLFFWCWCYKMTHIISGAPKIYDNTNFNGGFSWYWSTKKVPKNVISNIGTGILLPQCFAIFYNELVCKTIIPELVGSKSFTDKELSLIHIWRCRRYAVCRSRWSPYH